MGTCFPLHNLPQRLRDGGVIAISTAFFTQGINEIQSVANKLFGINKCVVCPRYVALLVHCSCSACF
jgi:hypothetical protein